MSRRTTLVTRIALVAVAAAALVALAPARTSAAANCGDAVLTEWSKKGDIHRPYPLRCYGEALKRMPQDIRSYSTAADDIQRAMLARQRKAGAKSGAEALQATPASRSSSAVPLLVVGAVGLALLLAAAVRGAFALRRLRGRS
jgi:hypothetical protein